MNFDTRWVENRDWMFPIARDVSVDGAPNCIVLMSTALTIFTCKTRDRPCTILPNRAVQLPNHISSEELLSPRETCSLELSDEPTVRNRCLKNEIGKHLILFEYLH